MGGKKTFWRRDDGIAGAANPTALSAYASFAQTIDKDVSNGLASQGYAGLIISSPWQSRPFDSYGLNVGWGRLTRDEQRLETQAYTASGGTGDYRAKRNEYSLSLDANIMLTDGVILSGYVIRTFNANTWMNPYAWSAPRDGLAFGLFATLLIDDMLGLSGHPAR
ncbi:hypothetical protein GRH90_11000 [Enterobacteriales bacterium SAP-6]|uniref:Uncharacterized protein n=2 Tax=Acerihabitans arboris TaxID=2691583 RepID=A0A845SEB6_9GAMM|nr:hypothetical protein [Acerihabitans arboris]